jgi:hypothetical protein
VTSIDPATVGVHRELNSALKALQTARQALESGAAAPDIDDLMGLANSMAAIQEQLMAVNSLMVNQTRLAERDRARRRA